MPAPFCTLIGSGSDSPAVAAVIECGTLHVAATCSLLPCYKSGRVQEPCTHGKCLFESHCLVAFLMCFLEPQALGVVPPTRKEEKMRLAWK